VKAPSTDDEGRHHPEPGQPAWEESWDFDFTTTDGALGGYVRLALHPHRRLAWFWAALVGHGRPLVIVIDHEIALPRGPDLDLRAEGLWTSFTCETPLEHWSVGLEAFGVALDDPTEAWRSLRGDRTALGLDLEWETAGPLVDAPQPVGYHLPCLVHGEVLVGAEVLAFEGSGGRVHAWGARRWDQASCTTAGRLDDRTTWYAHLPGVAPSLGPNGLPGPRRMSLQLGEGAGPLEVSVSPLHHAPVGVDEADGGPTRIVRSLCRYTTADGRRGAGWTEWNHVEMPRKKENLL
jgi:hypothetical protein